MNLENLNGQANLVNFQNRAVFGFWPMIDHDSWTGRNSRPPPFFFLFFICLLGTTATLRHWRRGGDAKRSRACKAVRETTRTRKSARRRRKVGEEERQGRSLTRNVVCSAPIFREEPVPGPPGICTDETVVAATRNQTQQHTCLLLLIYRSAIRVPSINATHLATAFPMLVHR